MHVTTRHDKALQNRIPWQLRKGNRDLKLETLLIQLANAFMRKALNFRFLSNRKKYDRIDSLFLILNQAEFRLVCDWNKILRGCNSFQFKKKQIYIYIYT